jgi:hypothetical protein
MMTAHPPASTTEKPALIECLPQGFVRPSISQIAHRLDTESQKNPKKTSPTISHRIWSPPHNQTPDTKTH